MLGVSSPLAFGNSWKAAAPPCSDVTTEIFPCERNSYCSAWAQRRCMIITGETFKDCHLKVCISHMTLTAESLPSYNVGMKGREESVNMSVKVMLDVLLSSGRSRSLLPSLCAGVLLLSVWREVPGLLHGRGSVRRGLQWTGCVRQVENTWFVPWVKTHIKLLTHKAVVLTTVNVEIVKLCGNFNFSGLLWLLQWAGPVYLALWRLWRDAHVRQRQLLPSQAGR